jgi:class 3 adenylate cyclase
MASFDDATGAVDASISIQRNVSNHNKARPDQPLQLRIGLNAGKPIQEENDIFGATVQLSARVCAATQPEQILCTESVQSRVRGRAEVIQSIGSQPLKGFKEPVPLYEVKW